MKAISELYDQHRQLEAQAARLLKIVGAQVADAAAVAGIRWQMAHALLEHCQSEDRAIYDRLLVSGDVTATALAYSYRQEFGALSAMFATYIADWPVDRINRNWIGFRADTETVMARLAERVAAEERDLYPRAEAIEQRRRAA